MRSLHNPANVYLACGMRRTSAMSFSMLEPCANACVPLWLRGVPRAYPLACLRNCRLGVACGAPLSCCAKYRCARACFLALVAVAVAARARGNSERAVQITRSQEPARAHDTVGAIVAGRRCLRAVWAQLRRWPAAVRVEIYCVPKPVPQKRARA